MRQDAGLRTEPSICFLQSDDVGVDFVQDFEDTRPGLRRRSSPMPLWIL